MRFVHDRNPHVSENLFKDLAKAYEVLSDKIKRADYNEKLMDDDELAYSNFSEDPIGSLISGWLDNFFSVYLFRNQQKN